MSPPSRGLPLQPSMFFILVTQSPLLCKNITFPNSTSYNKSSIILMDDEMISTLIIVSITYNIKIFTTIEVGTMLPLELMM
jgi:hypothetical protein